MEKMKKGTKKERLSALLETLNKMRDFYQVTLVQVKKERPWVMVEFEYRLSTIDNDLQILIESVEKALKNRNAKIDAPSLDAMMDTLVAIHHLSSKLRNPQGDNTPYKMLIETIIRESQVQTLWLNRVYNYLDEYISS